MAFKYAERVKETTTNKPATSATAFNLGGAKTGFRTFAAGVGTGRKCVYCAHEVDANGNSSGAWEVAVGTVTDATPDTLSRDHLIASSTGSFIDWSAAGENASPDVYVTFPAGIGEGLFGPIPWTGSVWHRPITCNNQQATGAFCRSNTVHCAPFFIPRPMILTGLRCTLDAGAAAGRNAYFGMYRARGEADETLDLVVTAAELDCSTTGEKSDTTLSTFLEPGLYFSALIGESNAMSFHGVGSAGAIGSLSAAVMGNANAMNNATGIGGYYDDAAVGAYGTLPSTITPDVASSTNTPIVEARFTLP